MNPPPPSTSPVSGLPDANHRHPPASVPIALINNSITPYRLAFHLRLARELPALRLQSVFTHDVSNSPWVMNCPPEVGPVYFGKGEDSATASREPVREWKKAAKIIQFLRESGTRAVILGGYNDLGRVRILRWCHAAGVPCFIWGDSNARSDHATGLKRAVKSAFLGHLLARTSGVMVCGSLGREFFQNYGANPAKVYYVPYEPDYDLIRALPDAAIRSAAATFDLQPARRRIVYSGRLVPEKRVDLLIRSFVTLAPDRPDWDLVLVGDGVLRTELEALVPTDLKSRVKWAGFQNDQAVVSAVYRNCDVLCLPSSYEPWALVINEAVAAGLAVVSSDVVGASAELVRDGGNGKLFRSGDLQSATDALRAATDPARIDALRAASPGVLADWRRRGDPVEGMRKALTDVGVL